MKFYTYKGRLANLAVLESNNGNETVAFTFGRGGMHPEGILLCKKKPLSSYSAIFNDSFDRSTERIEDVDRIPFINSETGFIDFSSVVGLGQRVLGGIMAD